MATRLEKAREALSMYIIYDKERKEAAKRMLSLVKSSKQKAWFEELKQDFDEAKKQHDITGSLLDETYQILLEYEILKHKKMTSEIEPFPSWASALKYSGPGYVKNKEPNGTPYYYWDTLSNVAKAEFTKASMAKAIKAMEGELENE